MPKKDSPLEPSAKELELLGRLRTNPLVAENIDLIMERFEEELANGADAHQAEEAVIAMLQNLGSNMMTQWAEQSSQMANQKACQDDSSLQKHTKKNFPGTPPSETSR